MKQIQNLKTQKKYKKEVNPQKTNRRIFIKKNVKRTTLRQPPSKRYLNVSYQKINSNFISNKTLWTSRQDLAARIQNSLQTPKSVKFPRTARGVSNVSKRSYHRYFILHGKNRKYMKVIPYVYKRRLSRFINIDFNEENESNLAQYKRLKEFLGRNRYTKKRLWALKAKAETPFEEYALRVFIRRRIYDRRLLDRVYLKPLLLGEVFITHKKRNIFMALFGHDSQEGKKLLFKTSAGLIDYRGPKKITNQAKEYVGRTMGSFMQNYPSKFTFINLIFTGQIARWLCSNVVRGLFNRRRFYVRYIRIAKRHSHGYTRLRKAKRK